MPEDEAAVAEVLSEIEQPPMQQPQQPPHGGNNVGASSYVMTPEMHEQFERQRMLQAQIEHQQELLNQREAQLEQRQTDADAAVMHMEEMAAAASVTGIGEENKSTSMLGSVASTISELVGSVFRLNVRQIAVAAALFMLFQYVNITIVVNAVMRALRMREFPCSANVDNGLVVQVARAVMFGTLVSVGNSVAA